MPDLSIDCPLCGAPNLLPVQSDQEDFTCTTCGETSRIDKAVQTGHAPVQDYLVGEVVGECKILAKIGEGGFGSVYRAEDQNLQRTVALKVMLPSLTTNVEFVQKFLREAVTAAQLSHPNIVGIHRVGKDDRRGIHYLIMEFVEGRTLSDIVKDKGVFPWQEALPLMIQSCDALAAAHEANIVHRDIKPENLMLDKSGLVKITDFGLAKSLSSEHKTTRVMGTPHYMSPEQFEGRAVDGRSDTYSLGVTFYYMLSRARPYEGQNTVQIIYSILTQQPKSLTDLNADVPPALWAVIEKMIAKKAEDRYATLREAIVDLKKLQPAQAEDKSACPHCGVKNKKGKFCRGCGRPLVVQCPACNSPEPAGAKTCSACGADLDKLVRVSQAMQGAKQFQALGDLRRAADAFRQVLSVDPTHAEASQELDRLRATLVDVDRVATEAKEAMRTGAIEGALERVEALLRRHPNANEIRQQRDDLKQALANRRVNHLVEGAETLVSEGKLREAMEVLDQALRVDAGREDVRALRTSYGNRVAAAAASRQRAAEALAAGRYEDAFQLASEVLQSTPGDAAMEELRNRARASVESVDRFISRGQQKVAENRLADALNEFEAALSLRPSDPRILGLVEDVRGRIAEQRERIGTARRMMADRQYRDAVVLLKSILHEQPDDVEAKSLLTSCERGASESEKLAALDHALDEAGRLEAAGETEKALEQIEKVRTIDPENEVARTRREQILRKVQEERALRELADEHAADGLFAEAVETLKRLRSVNPSRAAALDQEMEQVRRNEAQVKGSLQRAEAALLAKEYRRAAEASQQVLDLAPKQPRAAAIRKDADKAVAAIDRFIAECDKYLAAEMFDEALDALDKARERGATPEEITGRRDACEQGRLAILKTDATRSIQTDDFAAAIAAYENVLEVHKDDADALKGKRAAERRLKILTTEPLGLRLGTAALAVLSLGLLQFGAIQATRQGEGGEAIFDPTKALETKVVAVKTPEYAALRKTEASLDWKNALAAYKDASKEFPGDRKLLSGEQFSAAMADAQAASDPLESLKHLARAAGALGDDDATRAERGAWVADKVREKASQGMKAAFADEARAPDTAMATYGRLSQALQAPEFANVGQGEAPEIAQIDGLQSYMKKLRFSKAKERAAKPDFGAAAVALLEAKAAVAIDAARVSALDSEIGSLRGRWLDAVAAREKALGPKDDPAAEKLAEAQYYDEVVGALAEMARTFPDDTPEKVWQDFEKRKER